MHDLDEALTFPQMQSQLAGRAELLRADLIVGFAGVRAPRVLEYDGYELHAYRVLASNKTSRSLSRESL
jgi:hypothetical protein